MNDFAKRMQQLRLHCPGIQYLDGLMARILDTYEIGGVLVSDAEGEVFASKHGVSDWTLKVIETVLAIDGPIGLNLKIGGKYRWIGTVYDGPYDIDSAPEIVQDYSTFFPSELFNPD